MALTALTDVGIRAAPAAHIHMRWLTVGSSTVLCGGTALFGSYSCRGWHDRSWVSVTAPPNPSTVGGGATRSARSAPITLCANAFVHTPG
ncbi:hypothetical protein GCM10009827_117190 [Dactylosporangium maewongense]|uniref:Uncharacterized protein n=1 Tax=Dactylosporangium maewongense TaxID=634393 RepID=A0ABN2DH72_9ACTN